ncbi:hypothetical protein K2Y00_01755 [Patescibacteria group bacterium]|nr:hypothetical protein [Patescibacteria group bacterium]
MNTKIGRIGVGIVLVIVVSVVIFIVYTKNRDLSSNTSPEVSLNAEAVSGFSTPELYESSKFKVVSIVRNQFVSEFSTTTHHYDGLYVVVERGINDSSCGPYGPPTCYFFLESTWAYTPSIEYIGSYTGGPGIDPDSLRFIDENTVFFTASSGDGGGGVFEKWNLDVRTGSTTRLSSEYSGI